MGNARNATVGGTVEVRPYVTADLPAMREIRNEVVAAGQSFSLRWAYLTGKKPHAIRDSKAR